MFSNLMLSWAVATDQKFYCKSDDPPLCIQEYPKLCVLNTGWLTTIILIDFPVRIVRVLGWGFRVLFLNDVLKKRKLPCQDQEPQIKNVKSPWIKFDKKKLRHEILCSRRWRHVGGNLFMILRNIPYRVNELLQNDCKIRLRFGWKHCTTNAKCSQSFMVQCLFFSISRKIS